ncbi:MAG: M23 family metallopeptidase, partial [Candidatus Thiodiazotropha sp.]
MLGKKRPHRGVDYAAKTGTPIKAAGDGKVIFRGKKGGYGNAVIIQHGQTYTTLYGHLSKFNKAAKRG